MATSRCNASEAGFSLAETLVATAILATSIVALGQLFAIAITSNKVARNGTFATVLAQQKMEQLRGLTWGFDLAGLPLSDTTTDISQMPPTASGSGLAPPIGDTLTVNTAGFVDYLDQWGNYVGTGTGLPPKAVYIWRWSITPLPTNPNNTLILQVVVTRNRSTAARVNGDIGRMPEEARLVSIKTRKAQ